MPHNVQHSGKNDVRKKVIFVDRDDTIAIDVCHCTDPEKLILFDGVPEAIKKLNDNGYEIIVITNQSVIGRGMIGHEQLKKIHDKMISDVEKGGGRILDIFYCPHRPDENCECRKPKIKMGLLAMEKYNLKINDVIMIGDSDSDIQFGKNLGCRTIKVTKENTFVKIADEILNENDI